jgi:hypothetical protein
MLEARIAENKEINESNLKIVIKQWHPTVTRPTEYPILNLGNTGKSNSKVFYRRADKQSIIVERGRPAIDSYKSPMLFDQKGDLIKYKVTRKTRPAAAQRRRKKPRVRNYSTDRLAKWGEWKDAAGKKCSMAGWK